MLLYLIVIYIVFYESVEINEIEIENAKKAVSNRNQIYQPLFFPMQQVVLKCIGEGPVVHVTPTEMDWGQTQVLKDISRIVTLSNESLIPAPFTCHMVRNGFT